MAKGKYKEWLEDDKLLLLESWARNGLNDEQIAHNMGIYVSTLYTWQNKYSKIKDALKKGKEVVDIEIENAVVKAAKGYRYEEIKVEKEFGEVTKETRTTKEMPPNVTAAIFWLKHRNPDVWSDKAILNTEIEDLEDIDAEIYDDKIDKISEEKNNTV